MSKNYLSLACFLAALTVAMGAFGAHALKAIVDEHALAIYDTAVRYQFFHVLALALTGLIAKKMCTLLSKMPVCFLYWEFCVLVVRYTY